MKITLLKYLTQRAMKVNTLKAKYKLKDHITQSLIIEDINIIVPTENIDLTRIDSIRKRGMDFPIICAYTKGSSVIGSRKIDPNLSWSCVYGNKRLWYAKQAEFVWIESYAVQHGEVNRIFYEINSYKKEHNIKDN